MDRNLFDWRNQGSALVFYWTFRLVAGLLGLGATAWLAQKIQQNLAKTSRSIFPIQAALLGVSLLLVFFTGRSVDAQTSPGVVIHALSWTLLGSVPQCYSGWSSMKKNQKDFWWGGGDGTILYFFWLPWFYFVPYLECPILIEFYAYYSMIFSFLFQLIIHHVDFCFYLT